MCFIEESKEKSGEEEEKLTQNQIECHEFVNTWMWQTNIEHSTFYGSILGASILPIVMRNRPELIPNAQAFVNNLVISFLRKSSTFETQYEETGEVIYSSGYYHMYSSDWKQLAKLIFTKSGIAVGNNGNDIEVVNLKKRVRELETTLSSLKAGNDNSNLITINTGLGSLDTSSSSSSENSDNPKKRRKICGKKIGTIPKKKSVGVRKNMRNN